MMTPCSSVYPHDQTMPKLECLRQDESRGKKDQTAGGNMDKATTCFAQRILDAFRATLDSRKPAWVHALVLEGGCDRSRHPHPPAHVVLK